MKRGTKTGRLDEWIRKEDKTQYFSDGIGCTSRFCLGLVSWACEQGPG